MNPEVMQVMAWAIIENGVVYDLAERKDDLIQMWCTEPTPLFWINPNYLFQPQTERLM